MAAASGNPHGRARRTGVHHLYPTGEHRRRGDAATALSTGPGSARALHCGVLLLSVQVSIAPSRARFWKPCRIRTESHSRVGRLLALQLAAKSTLLLKIPVYFSFVQLVIDQTSAANISAELGVGSSSL